MRTALAACAAVAASALAFAFYVRVEPRWFALGWFGLVPWLALLDRTTSLRGALAAGLLMSVAFVLAVFGWFVDAIAGYTGGSWIVALVVVLLAAPLLQPQLVVFALVRQLVRVRAGFWRTTLTGAFAYVGAEWAAPKLFADTIGHGFYAAPLMRQAADLAGAHGLTFVLILANECVTASISPARWRRSARDALAPAACVASLVLGLLVYGAVRQRQLVDPERTGPSITAGLVQSDISDYARLRAEQGTFGAVRTILDAHFALSRQAWSHGGLDLLIWPETVYPTTFGSPKSEEGAEFDREIAAFVAGSGVPLVFGAYDIAGNEEFNAAVFLTATTAGKTSFETYRKTRLFPLTESVPWPFDSPAVRARMPWLGTWKPGRGPEVIALTLADGRTLRIAPLICLDAVDPSLALAAVRRGAELIVTLSNDSWFAQGGGPRLHLVVSAFRSLETRRPQLRATTSGVSAVITPTGEIIATAGVHERAVLVASVTPVVAQSTLILAWGDWFGPAAAAGAILLFGSSFVRR